MQDPIICICKIVKYIENSSQHMFRPNIAKFGRFIWTFSRLGIWILPWQCMADREMSAPHKKKRYNKHTLLPIIPILGHLIRFVDEWVNGCGLANDKWTILSSSMARTSVFGILLFNRGIRAGACGHSLVWKQKHLSL